MAMKIISLALMAILLSGCTANPQDSVAAGTGHNQTLGGITANNGTGSSPGNGTATAPSEVSNQTQVRLFTLEEVARHNTKADCWMVVQNFVLDLSGYAGHPGGNTYVPYCGKDGTEGFATKAGMGADHSDFAYRDAERYIIGKLGEPMPGQDASGTGSPTGNASSGTAPATQGNNTAPGGIMAGTSGDAPPPENASASNASSDQTAALLTMEEVAKHGTANDCWMVIYGKVLNLTAFTSHPGGSTYVPYCGAEATQAFDTKGGRGNTHSGAAAADLSAYTIGLLGQPQNRTVDAANVTISGGGDDDDDEWEDDD